MQYGIEIKFAYLLPIFRAFLLQLRHRQTSEFGLHRSKMEMIKSQRN